jgi:excisionase family DNA binding protein
MGASDEATSEWLTVAEVAAVLHTKAATVIRLLHKKTLPGMYLGTREGWRIRRSDVDALASAQQGELSQP